MGDRRVGAVILAAGASRRYGSPKQLVVVDGRTLLEHAIAAAQTAELAPIVAVVPVWLSRPATLDDDRLRWIRNPFPERGLSLSLRLAFDALGNEVKAALILLGDQPHVSPATIASVLAARGAQPLIAVSAGGVLAPPVLVERSHFSLVAGLKGDLGLRQILAADPELVRVVEVNAHSLDVDTPDDLGHILGP